VSRIPRARVTDDGIELMPVAQFLERLWGDQIVRRS
jgi:hypothetical protein